MASAKVISAQGAEVGQVDLDPAVFEVPLIPSLVHEVAVALMNAQRQGNHETKVRHQVRGGGRKPFRQKGTGNARQGSSREPHMRGGGVVFGPHKRSYRQKVTVAVRRKALCCVLSDRLREEALSVVDKLPVTEAPNAKAFASIVAGLAPNKGRTLFVVGELNRSLVRSARNLPRVEVRMACDVNALDILKARNVVVEQEAVTVLQDRLVVRREGAVA
jgi:large subunit ribosomal protein L4